MKKMKTETQSECTEHFLPMSHRCTAHKSCWLCQSCLEDHSQDSCRVITTDEELMDRKSVQLDKIKLLQDGYILEMIYLGLINKNFNKIFILLYIINELM